MSNNAIVTHDDASSYASQLVKMLSFTHEGAAGSTSFSFGVSKTTAVDTQNSSTSALLGDGVFGGGSGGGSAPAAVSSGSAADQTGGGGSGADNALITNDHASSYTSQWQKVLTFTHEGAAGSTGFSLGTSKAIHYDSQHSDTAALFGDGWGGSGGQIGGGTGGSAETGSGGTQVCNTGPGDCGGGSGGGEGCDDGSGGDPGCEVPVCGSPGGGSPGGGYPGGGYPGGGCSGGGYPGHGNVFTTHDSAINFDQEFVKTLSFAHEGAAGSTGFNFGTSKAVHYDSQHSDTAAMFDDGFLGSGLLDQIAHQGSSQALIG